jgi:hypothetical protein
MKTLPVLCAFTIAFAATTLAVVWLLPSDTAMRVTFSGLLTGYAGALLMFLTGQKPPPPPTG